MIFYFYFYFWVCCDSNFYKGAGSFWIHNTGPIGCLPVTTVNVHNPVPEYPDEIGCAKS